MENAYGLTNLWQEGDAVIRFVALVLLCMSMLSWYVMLSKLWQLTRLRRQASAAREGFWRAAGLEEALAGLGRPADANPFRDLAEDGIRAGRHYREAGNRLEAALGLSDWLTRALRNSLDTAAAQLQAGLGVLASVSGSAPFIGLFGTVWGIYHALVSIGVAGQASLDKVAGPVGEALIITALGLAVAIPASLGYNAVVRGNKAILLELNRFAHDLHAYLLSGARVAPSSGKGVVPFDTAAVPRGS